MPINPFRQQVSLDPAPSNQTPVGGNKYVQVLSSAALSGNPLLIASTIANLVGNKVTGVSQLVGGSSTAFTKIDELLNPSAGSATALWHLPNPGATGIGAKGTATGGSTTTVINSGATWTTNQWAGKTVSVYNKNQSAVVTSNTATTLTFPAGTISAAASDLYVVGDWFEFALTGSDDYNASLFMELDASLGIPTTAIGTLHSAQQGSSTAGTDTISTGSAALGTGSVLQIGVFMNDGDATSPYVANAGSVWNGSSPFWSFDLGQPLMRVGYVTLTNPGTTDMKATAQHTDHFQGFMVGLSLSTSGSFPPVPGNSPTNQQCRPLVCM